MVYLVTFHWGWLLASFLLGLGMGWIAVVHRAQGVSKVMARWLSALAVVVVGHAQAQSRRDEPALLRFEAWQLFGLIVIPFVFLTHGLLVTKAAAVVFVVLLGTVFLLRRRRTGAVEDF